MALILSVIVPVYNVERYVGKCIKSILNQDIPKNQYEIIVIDDGSTDHSGEICDQYAAENSLIRVIHQSNRGLSVARNVGLKHAQGKYVQFVDSDDYLEKNVYGLLLARMERDGLDVLRFGYQQIKESGEVTRSKSELSNESIVSGIEYLNSRLGVACYAWQFFLSRFFLISNSLFFKPGIIFEDTVWTPQMMLAANKVSEIDLLVYYYLEREGSITQAKTCASKKKKLSGMISLLDEMCLQRDAVERISWYNTVISHIVTTLITDISIEDYENRHKLLAHFKEKNVFPLSLAGASRKGGRKIRLINLSPRLACLFIHFRKRR